jgi:hypothetical protein
MSELTVEAFIRKWLGNPEKPYTKQFRDEMRDDIYKLSTRTDLTGVTREQINAVRSGFARHGFVFHYLGNTNEPNGSVIDYTIHQILSTLPLSKRLTDEEIREWAYYRIPITDEGNVEGDIDHAKRQLLIEGAKWSRDKYDKPKS